VRAELMLLGKLEMVQVPQATIVAYYGSLPKELEELVQDLQGLVGSEVGSFRPRALREVHATIIALDSATNVAVQRAKTDLRDVLNHLLTTITANPLTVQFGGFTDRDYALASRSQRLFIRSFSIDEGLATLIGWPVSPSSEGTQPTRILDRIRRECGAFNVHHKYHSSPTAVDPDMYAVVGAYDAETTSNEALQAAVHRARSMLADRPVRVPLSVEDIRVVVYMDPRLPAASSVAFPLSTPDIQDEVARLLYR
jgi:hypothetical protein